MFSHIELPTALGRSKALVTRMVEIQKDFRHTPAAIECFTEQGLPTSQIEVEKEETISSVSTGFGPFASHMTTLFFEKL